MSNEIVIKADNISKKFCRTVRHIMTYGAADIARDFFGVRSKTEELRDGEFWAVSDVNFELRKGETLGIIGHNGSGKSTILKMLNGIYMPDRGKIEINGRVGALIEVGAGFHPMLTGKENIYINGAILGMSKKETDKKYDEIVEFADIGDFINSPVRHYSSGMHVRLGMAIAVSLQPEILLIDEVLSVGDLSFQNKSMRRLAEIREKANAVVFVSHNLEHIRTLCQKVILLNRGEIVFYGDTGNAIEDYKELSAEMRLDGLKKLDKLTKSYGKQSTGEIEIIDSGIADESGNKVERLGVGDDITVFCDFVANVDVEEPLIGVSITDEKNNNCIWHVNEDMGVKLSPLFKSNRYHLTVKFLSPSIAPGIYRPRIAIRHASTYETYERGPSMDLFIIEGKTSNRGLVMCESKWMLNKI